MPQQTKGEMCDAITETLSDLKFIYTSVKSTIKWRNPYEGSKPS
jgi:hypothetical protein